MILVTGAAGFIGYHLCRKLGQSGAQVLGIDNLNDYYDPNLKLGRLRLLKQVPGFHFEKVDLNSPQLLDLIREHKPQVVINLAAQAGVRYSLENPFAYLDSNLSGFLRLLEALRYHPPEHFIFASSSSVYGASDAVPYSTEDSADRPVSLYAATKRANELMAHSYSSLFGIPSTGLRFFTVYGSWGRPDMAYWSFTRSIFSGEKVYLNNQGHLNRDFTHVSDVVESIFRLIPKLPISDSRSGAKYRVLNVGASAPVELDKFVSILEEHIGRKANRVYREMQKGDVLQTFADVRELESITGFRPQIGLGEGLGEFVDWYKANVDLASGKLREHV